MIDDTTREGVNPGVVIISVDLTLDGVGVIITAVSCVVDNLGEIDDGVGVTVREEGTRTESVIIDDILELDTTGMEGDGVMASVAVDIRRLSLSGVADAVDGVGGSAVDDCIKVGLGVVTKLENSGI